MTTTVMRTQELRARMLAAGQAWAAEQGPVLSLPGLSVAELARRAGASESAARAVWPADEDFTADLLCHLAGPGCFGAAAFDEETLNTGLAVIEQHKHRLATPEGRMAVIREAIRQALPRNLRATAESPEWRVYVALVGCLPAMADAGLRARVAGALARSVNGFAERMTVYYSAMAELLGLRPRDPGYRLEHLTTAGAALVEGFALRTILAQAACDGAPAGHAAGGTRWALLDVTGAGLPGPGIDGGTADWPLLAAAFLGLVDMFFEADPGFVPGEAVLYVAHGAGDRCLQRPWGRVREGTRRTGLRPGACRPAGRTPQRHGCGVRRPVRRGH